MSFVVLVRLTVQPERLEQFMPRMMANADASLAAEPDCHQFAVATDADRPGEILLYERYTDRAAFDAHLASPHYLSFDAETADMVRDKQVEFWREVEP